MWPAKQVAVVPKAKQYPIEVKLYSIAPDMRSFGPILECLKVSIASLSVNFECVSLVQTYSSVSDFKFTDEEKSSAYVKFMS